MFKDKKNIIIIAIVAGILVFLIGSYFYQYYRKQKTRAAVDAWLKKVQSDAGENADYWATKPIVGAQPYAMPSRDEIFKFLDGEFKELNVIDPVWDKNWDTDKKIAAFDVTNERYHYLRDAFITGWMRYWRWQSDMFLEGNPEAAYLQKDIDNFM